MLQPSEPLPPRFVDAALVVVVAYALVMAGLGVASHGHGYAAYAFDAFYAAFGALLVGLAWRFSPRLLGRSGWSWNLGPALAVYVTVALASVVVDLAWFDVALWRSGGWPLHYADLAFCGAVDCEATP